MKVFFALIALLCIGHRASIAQDNVPPEQAANDVKWFETIFQAGNRTPSEKEINKKENEKLIAIENHDPRKEIRVLMELGAIHLTRLKSREEAIQFFIESLTIEDSLRLEHEKVFTLLAIARVFEEVYEFDRSVEYIDQAQDLNDNKEYPEVLMLILNELGRIHTKSGNTETAIEKYQQILTYADNLGSKRQQAEALFNLGKLHMQTLDYQKSLEFHKKALALQRSLNDKKSEARSLNSFAQLYLLLKNPDRAMANQLAALDIRKELRDTAGMAFTYNRIGELHLRDNDYSHAVGSFDLALKAALETEQQEEIRKSYDYLSQSYKAMKDFSKALDYRESFISIDDFIRNENSSLQLTDVRNRYMLLQKEKEINQLESGRRKSDLIIKDQARIQNFLFALIALVLIIVALVVYLYFVKRKVASSLKEVNDAKDKLFSIIGHDIKGPLNSLMSFSSLLSNHGDMITKEEIKMLSTDLDKSLKNLFSLLENLLQWARSQTGNMDFRREEFNVVDLLNENKQLLQTQASNKNIKLVSHYEPLLLANADINSVDTVIRNLLSNAIKFTSKNGTITLQAEDHKTHILISITDTGVGISPEAIQKLFKIGTKHSTLGTANEKGTGLGLMLCKEFVEKNGGTIGVTSKPGEGSTFYFTVPS